MGYDWLFLEILEKQFFLIRCQNKQNFLLWGVWSRNQPNSKKPTTHASLLPEVSFSTLSDFLRNDQFFDMPEKNLGRKTFPLFAQNGRIVFYQSVGNRLYQPYMEPPICQSAFMKLETENTNFQTQIHIVSESPSLSFPKGLLLFSGQTTFIIISLVRTLSDRRQNCYSQSPLFFVDPYMFSETFCESQTKAVPYQ